MHTYKVTSARNLPAMKCAWAHRPRSCAQQLLKALGQAESAPAAIHRVGGRVQSKAKGLPKTRPTDKHQGYALGLGLVARAGHSPAYPRLSLPTLRDTQPCTNPVLEKRCLDAHLQSHKCQESHKATPQPNTVGRTNTHQTSAQTTATVKGGEADPSQSAYHLPIQHTAPMADARWPDTGSLTDPD